jgi:hypothetical protein
MSSLILALMMQVATTQFLVSTKAGLVNYVLGPTTVKVATTVPAGQFIATGPGGAVEILLNPGSYLRMGENSRVVLDRVELYDIAVRIIEGSMVIEANGFDDELPLVVTSGSLKLDVIKNGVYLFADGKVVVIDGKIRHAESGRSYGKNFQLSSDHGHIGQKVKRFATGLELWSQKRSEEISRANLNVARSLRQVRDLPVASFHDVWLWYPAFGSFIYMPGARYRSPYGYRYQTAGDVYYGGSGVSSGGGSSSASNSGFGGGSNTSSGSGSSSSGGGSSPIGASGAPPALRSEPAAPPRSSDSGNGRASQR